MPENFANRYQTALAAGITAGAATGMVTSVVGIPAYPFRAIISAEGANTDEIVLVTLVAGTTLTWTRAAEAVAGVQAASAHSIGATFTAIVTATGLLNATVYDVRAYGATGLGVADDTVAIQAALTACRLGGGGFVRGRPGDTYLIAHSLVIGSKTVLDMTGATVTMDHSTERMLYNYNLLGAPTRDTDIAVIGGTWVETGTPGSGAEGSSHRLAFNQIDRLVIRDLRITSTSGKYAIELSDLTEFLVTNITLNVHSDGVHVTGPASRGTIRNVSGVSRDDMVAFTCSNWTDQDISRGDITDVTVQTIRAYMTTGAGRAVMLSTTGDASYLPLTIALRRLTISDIKGTTMAHGVVLYDGVTNANASTSDVTVADVSVIVPSGYGEISVQSPNAITGLVVENVHIPTGANDNTYAVWIQTNMTALTVRGIRSTSTGRVTGLYLSSGVTITTVVMSDVVMTLPSSISDVVAVSTTSTISDLSLIDVATDGSGNGNVIHLTSGSASITRLNLINITYNSGNGGILYHQSSSAPDVNFSNVRMLSAGVIFYLISTGAVTIRGAGATAPTYWVYRSAAQVIYCYSTDIHCDVDVLTPIVGGMAYNTNGAHGCGVGPVVSEGTHWKGLYNGTAYP